ncbi:type II secretion system major pseudopilin GspG [Rhodobacter sp. NTK016B]|uniref:type II secretion system major pseudopilin GspG n=1 Tax=Rhodobacter sp. NTK016B TaxID=2759676 RepID=UPI001A8E36F4|nr:type II secretion system major pseudopilin GspG [Rhodobacter sp. NTK016B]MBN8292970.1 type II secretion system major pseudopilin GspG [Rhodobacter sp. NTK016B]
MAFHVPFKPKRTFFTKKRRRAGQLRRDAGLTLIELMVVVVILALLAVVIVPRVIDRPDQARAARAQSDIAAIGSALNLYRLDTGSYPSTDQGLAALVSRPTIAPVPQNWADGGYLERVPEDPWGRAYLYLAPGVHGPYDLVSYGADGRSGGTGADADITSWQGE